MISVSLPPVFFGFDVTEAEILEAHAMTYWARYCTQAISARVLSAMQRAWCVVDAQMYPRSTTVPGFVAVRIGTNGVYRLIIAIEGSTDMWNILNGADPLSFVSVPGCNGFVSQFIMNGKTACAARVTNPSVIYSALANPRIPVTFCGHSLGGAIAEVWAAAHKAAFPTKSVKYVSFASPCVGDLNWVREKNPSLRFRHIYTDTDQIACLRWSNFLSTDLLTPGVGLLHYANTQREATATRVLKNGSQLAGLPRKVTWGDTSMYVRQLGGVLTPSSIWWQHQAAYYRLCMMAKASVMGAEMKYRYTNLEFEDENQWQVLYRLGADLDPAFNNLVIPGPADATPPNADVQALAGEPPPTVQRQGQIDPAVAAVEMDDWGEGSPWDIEPIISSQYRPQRTRRVRQ